MDRRRSSFDVKLYALAHAQTRCGVDCKGNTVGTFCFYCYWREPNERGITAMEIALAMMLSLDRWPDVKPTWVCKSSLRLKNIAPLFLTRSKFNARSISCPPVNCGNTSFYFHARLVMVQPLARLSPIELGLPCWVWLKVGVEAMVRCAMLCIEIQNLSLSLLIWIFFKKENAPSWYRWHSTLMVH